MCGVPMRDQADVTGGTEPALFRANLRLNWLDVDGLFDRFATEQAEEYRERWIDLRACGRALQGAEAALRALAGRDDLAQTVTGNTQPASQLKLEAFDLATYLTLEAGTAPTPKTAPT